MEFSINMKNTEEITQEIENRIKILEEYITNFIQNQPSLMPQSFTAEEVKKINYLQELRDLINWIKE